jgi:AcrR family transcriptional regulator
LPESPASSVAAAAAHDAILDAVYVLLHQKSVCDLTIEEVARRAGVGKPTIYKWWPSKAALVMDTFVERIIGKMPVLGARTVEDAIRSRVRAAGC